MPTPKANPPIPTFEGSWILLTPTGYRVSVNVEQLTDNPGDGLVFFRDHRQAHIPCHSPGRSDYTIECSGEDPQFEDTKEAALAVAEVLLAEDRASAAFDGEWPDSAETIRVYRRELVAASKAHDVEGGVDFNLTELAVATATDAELIAGLRKAEACIAELIAGLAAELKEAQTC